jgi:hypothetical protein
MDQTWERERERERERDAIIPASSLQPVAIRLENSSARLILSLRISNNFPIREKHLAVPGFVIASALENIISMKCHWKEKSIKQRDYEVNRSRKEVLFGASKKRKIEDLRCDEHGIIINSSRLHQSAYFAKQDDLFSFFVSVSFLTFKSKLRAASRFSSLSDARGFLYARFSFR